MHVSLLSASGELVAMGLWPAGARDGHSVTGHGQTKAHLLSPARVPSVGLPAGPGGVRGVGRAGSVGRSVGERPGELIREAVMGRMIFARSGVREGLESLVHSAQDTGCIGFRR